MAVNVRSLQHNSSLTPTSSMPAAACTRLPLHVTCCLTRRSALLSRQRHPSQVSLLPLAALSYVSDALRTAAFRPLPGGRQEDSIEPRTG